MELDPEAVAEMIARLQIANAAMRLGNDRAEAALDEIRRRRLAREHELAGGES